MSEDRPALQRWLSGIFKSDALLRHIGATLESKAINQRAAGTRWTSMAVKRGRHREDVRSRGDGMLESVASQSPRSSSRCRRRVGCKLPYETRVTFSERARTVSGDTFRFRWGTWGHEIPLKNGLRVEMRSELVVSGGRDRRRSGDLTLFRRALYQLSYPTG